MIITHAVEDLWKDLPREPKKIVAKKGRLGKWHLCQQRVANRRHSLKSKQINGQTVKISLPTGGQMLCTRQEMQMICANTTFIPVGRFGVPDSTFTTPWV